MAFRLASQFVSAAHSRRPHSESCHLLNWLRVLPTSRHHGDCASQASAQVPVPDRTALWQLCLNVGAALRLALCGRVKRYCPWRRHLGSVADKSRLPFAGPSMDWGCHYLRFQSQNWTWKSSGRGDYRAVVCDEESVPTALAGSVTGAVGVENTQSQHSKARWKLKNGSSQSAQRENAAPTFMVGRFHRIQTAGKN